MGETYGVDVSSGSLLSNVYRTCSPGPAVIVTACAVEYAPVPGAIDGTSGPSVYAAVTIALGASPAAHARTLSVTVRSIEIDAPSAIVVSVSVGAAPEVV